MGLIGDFLRRKVRNAAIDASERDLSNFVKSISPRKSEEITMLVAITGFCRLAAEANRGYDLDTVLFDGADGEEQLSLQLFMKSGVAACKATGAIQGVGFMVWLHTMRSYLYPEVRGLSQQMWRELSRGFDAEGVRRALIVVCDRSGDMVKAIEASGQTVMSAPTVEKCMHIPSGMEVPY